MHVSVQILTNKKHGTLLYTGPNHRHSYSKQSIKRHSEKPKSDKKNKLSKRTTKSNPNNFNNSEKYNNPSALLPDMKSFLHHNNTQNKTIDSTFQLYDNDILLSTSINANPKTKYSDNSSNLFKLKIW